MLCKNKRCGRDIQSDAKFCPYCGRLQTDKHRMRRSNGEGSIFQMPDKRWKAEIIVAYEIDGISGKLARYGARRSPRPAQSWQTCSLHGKLPASQNIRRQWHSSRRKPSRPQPRRAGAPDPLRLLEYFFRLSCI